MMWYCPKCRKVYTMYYVGAEYYVIRSNKFAKRKYVYRDDVNLAAGYSRYMLPCGCGVGMNDIREAGIEDEDIMKQVKDIRNKMKGMNVLRKM